jgi:hypothetical protein
MVQNQDRFSRHRHRDSNHNHPGIGALIFGSIIIIAGLAVFLPTLSWNIFWASLLVLLGLWIIGGFAYKKTIKQ